MFGDSHREEVEGCSGIQRFSSFHSKSLSDHKSSETDWVGLLLYIGEKCNKISKC